MSESTTSNWTIERERVDLRAAVRAAVSAPLRQLALPQHRTGLEAGQALAARDERLVAGLIVVEALTGLGCTATVFSDDARTGIWAERDHQMVAVLLEDTGKTQIDIAGCEGGSCTPLHHELEMALAAAGVRLRDIRHNSHRDARGGSLIQRAAACGAASMAEGLVTAKASRFTPTAAATAEPTRVWTS